jgi:hypothetical protein
MPSLFEHFVGNTCCVLINVVDDEGEENDDDEKEDAELEKEADWDVCC